jgi:hypothetical protein
MERFMSPRCCSLGWAKKLSANRVVHGRNRSLRGADRQDSILPLHAILPLQRPFRIELHRELEARSSPPSAPTAKLRIDRIAGGPICRKAEVDGLKSVDFP